MTVQGIDVSTYQRNVDYNKLKQQGISFVIIRAGYGRYLTQKDIMFEEHYKNAKAAGLDVGAYWYSYATSADDAEKEAKTCLEAIKGKKFEYPIYFDLEEWSQLQQGANFCSNLITSFCSTIEKAGYFAGLYMSRSHLQNYVKPEVAKKYTLWVAEYGSSCNYNGSYGIWQNTSTYHANGYSGNLDHDYCYVDYPTIIKQGGFNGYTKPKELKELDTSGLKYDDKNGIAVLALKQLLLGAKSKGWVTANFKMDYGFGTGTQSAVNQVLKKWGYKENGIAGDNFIGKLGSDLTK